MKEYIALFKSLLGTVDVGVGELSVSIGARYQGDDDDFLISWRGKIFLDLRHLDKCGDWMAKLAKEYEVDTVTEGVAVLPAHANAGWHHLGRSYSRCYLEEKDGTPVAILYLGLQTDRFIDLFAPHGDVELGIPDDEPELVVRTRPSKREEKRTEGMKEVDREEARKSDNDWQLRFF